MHNHAVLEEEERAYAPPEEIIPAVQVKPRAPIPQKALFEDSLLDPSGQRGRRTRATLFSFILQSFLVVVLILMPLLYTDVLPTQQLVTFLIVAPPPPPPPAASAVVKVVKVMSDIANGQLRTPSRIPAEIQMIKEEEAPPPLNVTNGVLGGVPGGIPGGQLGGVIGGIISSTSRLAPVLPSVAPKRLRISQGVSQGMLITKIEPVYPNLAKAARIQGAVVLTAIVSKEGTIQNLQLVSGHPMLAPAAMEAVKRWRYRPYLLNGQPVEVETTITVTFRFQS